MKKLILSVSFSLILVTWLAAQDSIIRNPELSMSFGFSEVNAEKHSSGENMNYLNYIENYPEYLDYIIVKFGFRFDFLKNMSADVNFIMFGDFIPIDYDISAQYFFNGLFGLGFGSVLNSHYFFGFEDFLVDRNYENYYLDTNERSFHNYDLGIYITPLIRPIHSGRLSLTMKCDLGVSTFLTEKQSFYMKERNTNKRMKYHYKTNLNLQPFIKPKIRLKANVFKWKNMNVGIVAYCGYLLSKRSMDYSRSIQLWTEDNSTNEDISIPAHDYSRFDFDFGLNVEF